MHRKLSFTLISVFCFKVVSAAIGLVLTFLVTKTMAIDDSGYFLLGLSLVVVGSSFFRLGLDNAVIKYIASHEGDRFSQNKLNLGITWILCATVPVALVSAIYAEEITLLIYSSLEMEPIFKYMVPSIPAMCIFNLLACAFQASKSPIFAIVFQNMAYSTVFIAIYLIVYMIFDVDVDSDAASFIFFLCCYIVLFFSIFCWFYNGKRVFSVSAIKDKELFATSLKLWLATILTLIVGWSSMFIAGVTEKPDDIARFSASHRVANLINFILIVVNLVISPKYALYWKEGQYQKIRKLYKQSTILMCLIVLPVFTVVLFFNNEIMSIFGAEYSEAGVLLLILSIGQFINIATGSVGYLLNMTGHEKHYMFAILISSTLTLIASFYLIGEYGILGAAYGTAFGLASQNIFAFIVVRRKLTFLFGN